MKDTVKAAMLQTPFQRNGKMLLFKENFANVMAGLKRAVKEEADLVMTSEYSLSFTRAFKVEFDESGVCGVDQNIRPFVDFCAEHGLYFILHPGDVEFDGDRQGKHTTQLFIGPDGVLGTYSKTHLFPWEAETLLLHWGSEMPVFDTPLGKIGIANCQDMMLPEFTRIYAHSGAEIVACSSSQPGKFLHPWLEFCTVRAMESLVYVLCNGPAGIHDVGTFAASPDLEYPVVAQCSPRRHTVLTAELDMKWLRSMRDESFKHKIYGMDMKELKSQPFRDEDVWKLQPEFAHDFGGTCRAWNDARPDIYLRELVPLWLSDCTRELALAGDRAGHPKFTREQYLEILTNIRARIDDELKKG